MRWDEWRGSEDGRPTMFIKRLFHLFGLRVDLHKFVRADDAECFHTHPAHALRIILWGGYVEQLYLGPDITSAVTYFKAWRFGGIGVIRPAYTHRIDRLLNGKASYSLWLRTRSTQDVQLLGEGWGPK